MKKVLLILGVLLATATMLARDLVNTPAGDMTPLQLADAAKQTRHPDYDWPLCLSKEVDSVVQHKAMAELQKEAQERGDYGRGDKT